MLDEEVIELSHEAPSQLLLIGLLVDDRIPGAAEVVDEFREWPRTSRDKPAFEPKLRNSR